MCHATVADIAIMRSLRPCHLTILIEFGGHLGRAIDQQLPHARTLSQRLTQLGARQPLYRGRTMGSGRTAGAAPFGPEIMARSTIHNDRSPPADQLYPQGAGMGL